MFSLFSSRKSVELKIGILQTFNSILSPNALGPVVYQGFIPDFMDGFILIVKDSTNVPMAFGEIVDIFGIISGSYPKIFECYFLVSVSC